LANTEILNLLDIPHFGRGHDVNNCVKKLMSVTHIGYLSVEEPVSINVELISYSTGLPFQGENHALYLNDKIKEKALVEEMKITCDIERGSCQIIIKKINDATTRMATKLMAYKLLKKCCKEEVPAGVVVAES